MIYVGLYLVVAFVSLITNNGKKLYGRLLQCVSIFICMLLIMGLRSVGYGGADTIVYVRDFNRLCTYNSLGQVMDGFYKDYGFYIFSWMFSRICKDSQVWLCVCAIPYLFAVTRMIYKYSRNVFFSFFMFLAFDYYMYNFQLMRHVFSIAFVVCSFEYLLKQNYFKYVIFVVLGVVFHPFAILFLAVIPLQKSEVGWKQILLLLLGSIGIVIIMKTSLLHSIFSLTGSAERFGHFADSASGSLSNFFIHLLFAMSAWIMLYGKHFSSLESQTAIIYKQNRKLNGSHRMILRLPKNHIYECAPVDYGLMMNLSIVSDVLYLGQIGVGESYRVAQYFSIFTVLFIPNVYRNYKDKTISIALILLVVAFGLRHFFGGLFVDGSVYNPYVFFWE